MANILAKLKGSWPQRPNALLFLPVSYFVWGAVTLRWITVYNQQGDSSLWPVTVFLLIFGLLMGLEPLITQNSPLRTHAYMIFQTGLVFAASLYHFELDFFALLYIPLCGQAMFLFPRRTAVGWLGILILATIGSELAQFGWPEALTFILLYVGGLVFVAAFSISTLRAEEAQRRSAELLVQLQEAHEQLKDYADQAEKLAIANERNRLARDLHDSVAQTLYGLALQFETAVRKLNQGQVADVEDDLRKMQESTQRTLQETRLLIYELRPPILEEEGLAAAVNQRLLLVEGRSGLSVQSRLEEAERPSAAVELAYYRIAQEALNNIIKHAQATSVDVALYRQDGRLILRISDDGCGFNTQESAASGGLGLQGMRERASSIGARLQLQSAPGQGTKIVVESS